MTTTPVRPLFGQYLGQAQAASRAGLDQVLAERGTTFDHWVTLNALALGPGTPAPPPEPEALADLVAAGLVATALTPAGEERYAELRTAVADFSARLTGDIDPDDLETARRVLEQMARAAAS